MIYTLNMRNILILVVMLIATGCSKGPNNIEPEFQELFDSFLEDANSRGRYLPDSEGISIKMVDFIDPSLASASAGTYIIGFCDGQGNVSILRSYWEIHSDPLRDKHIGDMAKKALIYHELGHCILGRGHTDNDISIMYPDDSKSLPALLYHQEEALNELFH